MGFSENGEFTSPFERELNEEVLLCDSEGYLNPEAVGWSRRPVFNCKINGRRIKKKKWNYWLITSDKYLFSVTIANLDYAGTVFAYFYDIENGIFIEKTINTSPLKACKMPDNPGMSMEFNTKKMRVSFFEEDDLTKIYVNMPDFNGKPLRAEFFIESAKGHETLNVVIPWSKREFQFTSKQNCLKAYGTVEIGNKLYDFDDKHTMASLDFGRGIWPRRSFWNWATFSGMEDERSLGINLGGVWTDGTGMTENGVIVDGRISKISDRVVFNYDVSDLMKPWSIKTENTGQVDLIFTPIYKRLASTDYGVIKSNIYQMFGYFSGNITTSEGEKIEVKRILGCAEEHKTKW